MRHIESLLPSNLRLTVVLICVSFLSAILALTAVSFAGSSDDAVHKNQLNSIQGHKHRMSKLVTNRWKFDQVLRKDLHAARRLRWRRLNPAVIPKRNVPLTNSSAVARFVPDRIRFRKLQTSMPRPPSRKTSVKLIC